MDISMVMLWVELALSVVGIACTAWILYEVIHEILYGTSRL